VVSVNSGIGLSLLFTYLAHFKNISDFELIYSLLMGWLVRCMVMGPYKVSRYGRVGVSHTSTALTIPNIVRSLLGIYHSRYLRSPEKFDRKLKLVNTQGINLWVLAIVYFS